MAVPTTLVIDALQETLEITNSRDATALRGYSIEAGPPTDGEGLFYQASSSEYVFRTVDEAIDDRVAALIQPSSGNGITWTYDDDAGTLVPTLAIKNADVSATAEIAVSKLADGSSRQLLQTDSGGTGVEWTSNVDVPGTLDVTGAAVFDGSVTASAFTGVASSATVLATARAINGVDFDGSAAITVTAAADTLSGTEIKSTVVTSSLTQVGAVATGSWIATAIADAYVANDLTISGGTVNNSVIGGSTPAAGSFTQLDVTAEGDLRLQDAAGGQYVGLDAPATVSSSYTLTMPAEVGSVNQVLSLSNVDGTLQWSTPEEGDVESVANATNGGLTATNSGGPNVTLALNFADLSAAAVNVANDSIAIIDNDDSSTKKESIADLATAFAGNGLAASSGVLAVGVDDSSIELSGDALRVKALGITNAMLGGSIANAKLSNSTVSYGGVTLSLGGSDSTPAINLSHADSYPGDSSLVTVGVVTSGQWNGTAITSDYIDVTSSPLAETKIWIGDSNGDAQEFALSGNATMTAGGVVTVSTAAACSGNAATATLASTVTVADSSDTTAFPAFFDSATGSLAIMTDASNLTYNADTGMLSATGFTGPLTGSCSGSSGSTTGNAATATALATARTIGGTSFDGTDNVVPATITVAATTDATCSVALFESATGDLAPKTDAGLTYNATSNVLAGTFSGDITGDVTGNVSGSAASLSATLAVASGGTNISSFSAGDILYASGSTTLAKLAKGSDTEVLTLASGVPSWSAPGAAAAGSLTGTELKSTVVTSSLTSVGTLTGLATSGSGAQTIKFESTDNDCTVQIATDTDELQNSILAFNAATTTKGSIVYDHHPTAATQTMQFLTEDNGTVAMTLKAERVGIGDEDPQDVLEVRGPSAANGGITISNANATGANLSFARSSTATARIQLTEPGTVGTGDLRFYVSNEDGTPSLVEALRIEADQDVLIPNGGLAIGTTSSPAVPMDVHGALSANGTENVARIQAGGTTQAGGLTINCEYGATAAARTTSLFSIDGQSQACDLSLGSGSTVAMTIDTSQNVGIGTADPAELLHLYGTGTIKQEIESLNTDAYLIINSGADGSGGSNREEGAIKFYQDNADFYTLGKRDQGYFSLYDHTASAYVLQFGDNGACEISPANDILYIDGNVGIGQAAPSEPLDVRGAGYTASFDTSSGDWGGLKLHNSSGGTYDGQVGALTLNSGNVYVGGESGVGVIVATNGQTGMFINDANYEVTFPNTTSMGINTTSPDGMFMVKDGDTVIAANTSADNIVVSQESGDCGISILSGNSNSIINFGDSASADPGSINYIHGDNQFRIKAADANILWIASDGFYLGNNVGDNQFRTASAGSGSTTMYIGNQSITTSSDRRLKTNIVDSSLDAVDALNQLRVTEFEWDDPSDTSFNNRNARGVWTGMIAQEVVEHLPFTVNAPRDEEKVIDYDSDSTWSIEPMAMCGVLVKAIQELSTRIQDLEGQLDG